MGTEFGKSGRWPRTEAGTRPARGTECGVWCGGLRCGSAPCGAEKRDGDGPGMARLIAGAVSGHAAGRMSNERVTSQERKVRNVSNKVRKKRKSPARFGAKKMAKHRK